MLAIPASSNLGIAQFAQSELGGNAMKLCQRKQYDWWCTSPNGALQESWDLEEIEANQPYFVQLQSQVPWIQNYTTIPVDWSNLPSGFSLQGNFTGQNIPSTEWSQTNTDIHSIWLYRQGVWKSWQKGVDSTRITTAYQSQKSIRVETLDQIEELEAFWVLHKTNWVPKPSSSEVLSWTFNSTGQTRTLTTGLFAGLSFEALSVDREISVTVSIAKNPPTSASLGLHIEMYPLHPQGLTARLPLNTGTLAYLRSNSTRLAALRLQADRGSFAPNEFVHHNDHFEFKVRTGSYLICDRLYQAPDIARVEAVAENNLTLNTNDFKQATGRVAVFVHGLNGNPENFSKTAGPLNWAKDYTVNNQKYYDSIWIFRYPSGLDMSTNGKQLQEVLSKNSDADLHLYGHSKGGLISRFAHEIHGPISNLSHFITIGTPHEGSPIADVGAILGISGFGAATGDLSSSSPNITTLKNSQLISQTRYLFLGGQVQSFLLSDGLVAPSSALPAKNHSDLTRVLFYNSFESNLNLVAHRFGHEGLVDYWSDSSALNFLDRVETANAQGTLSASPNGKQTLASFVENWLQ